MSQVQEEDAWAPSALAFPAAALLLGLLAQSSQILLLRELFFPAGGSPELLGIFLWAWMLGCALGALAGAHRPGLPLLLPAAVALPPLTLLGFRLWGPLPPLAGPISATGLELMGTALITVTPTALVLGLCFSRLAGTGAERGARVYDLEALGAFAAGLLLSFLALPRGGSFLPLALLAVPCLCLRRRWRLYALLAVGLLGASPFLDSWTRKAQWQRIRPGASLLESRETQRGNRTVLEQAGEQTVYLGGSLHRGTASAFDIAGPLHLAALQAPATPRILLLGHVSPALGQELARHAPRQAMVAAAWLEDLAPLPGEGPWPSIFQRQQGDPRAVLAGLPRACLDLLLLALDPVADSEAWRLSSLEAVRAMSKALADGGVLALLLAATDGELPKAQRRLQATVLAAVSSAFAHVQLVPGATTILLASPTPLPALQPEALSRRWQQRGLSSEVFHPDFFADLVRPEEQRQRLEELGQLGAQPSRDLHPILQEFGRQARREEAGGEVGERALWWLGLLLPLLLLALALATRKRGGRLPALAMTGTGFLGTAFTVLLLCSLAAGSGTLYGHVGLVTGSTMFGLWAGARLGRGPGRGLPPWLAEALNLGYALALAALLPLLVTLHGPASLATHAVLALGAGSLLGISFPIYVRLGHGAAGRTYATDLLGGAVGALCLGAWIIPELGARAACLLCALVKLPTLICWLAQAASGRHANRPGIG